MKYFYLIWLDPKFEVGFLYHMLEVQLHDVRGTCIKCLMPSFSYMSRMRWRGMGLRSYIVSIWAPFAPAMHPPLTISPQSVQSLFRFQPPNLKNIHARRFWPYGKVMGSLNGANYRRSSWPVTFGAPRLWSNVGCTAGTDSDVTIPRVDEIDADGGQGAEWCRGRVATAAREYTIKFAKKIHN